MSDPFHLDRFVSAQGGGVHERALDELHRGRKATHWMWFVFPQVAGLGRSATAQHYAISGLDEASAYLAHPVLGPRLREAAGVAASVPGGSADAIFGGIDAAKLRSSMTLFVIAEPGEPVFRKVLERFFGGRRDEATERIVSPPGGADAGPPPR